jgi:hypothetical protein
MGNPNDKRARIIAAQVAREEADRASGRLPTIPEARSNWAASPSPKRVRKPPGRPRQVRSGRPW